MKDLNNWKEGPVDCVLLSFRFLQQYYLHEIRRGRAAIGNYTLRDDMAELKIGMEALDIQPPISDYKAIVAFIQETKVHEEIPRKEEERDLTTSAKAKEIVMANRISLCPQFGSFLVLGATGKSFVVKIFPKEACTCPIDNSRCCHVLAVKMALRMDIDADYVVDQNLTKIRKKVRGKSKPGRKQPRPGDVDVENEPEEKKIRIKIEEPEREPDRKENEPFTIDDSDDDLRPSIDVVTDNLWQIDTEGVKINLTQEDRERIRGTFANGWLTDSVMDAAQAIP